VTEGEGEEEKGEEGGEVDLAMASRWC